MSATVLKFPAKPQPSHEPDALEPPTLMPFLKGENPHVFFRRVMLAWTVDAERACGAEWCREVLKAQSEYMAMRSIFNR